jgi:cell wall-associated NlpC family hydrolase
LLGRRFVHGVLDCWALCRDWYAREWGVALPDPDRHDGWWDDGTSNLYLDNLDAAGFDIVQDGTMERGDLLLMQIRSKNQVPNHAGVYLGEGKFIHHLYGRLSTREVWGGYWREKLRYVARLRNRAAIAKPDNVQ